MINSLKFNTKKKDNDFLKSKSILITNGLLIEKNKIKVLISKTINCEIWRPKDIVKGNHIFLWIDKVIGHYQRMISKR